MKPVKSILVAFLFILPISGYGQMQLKLMKLMSVDSSAAKVEMYRMFGDSLIQYIFQNGTVTWQFSDGKEKGECSFSAYSPKIEIIRWSDPMSKPALIENWATKMGFKSYAKQVSDSEMIWKYKRY
jgi:hypothetical protein